MRKDRFLWRFATNSGPSTGQPKKWRFETQASRGFIAYAECRSAASRDLADHVVYRYYLTENQTDGGAAYLADKNIGRSPTKLNRARAE